MFLQHHLLILKETTSYIAGVSEELVLAGAGRSLTAVTQLARTQWRFSKSTCTPNPCHSNDFIATVTLAPTFEQSSQCLACNYNQTSIWLPRGISIVASLMKTGCSLSLGQVQEKYWFGLQLEVWPSLDKNCNLFWLLWYERERKTSWSKQCDDFFFKF